jgi:hypothetical protein
LFVVMMSVIKATVKHPAKDSTKGTARGKSESTDNDYEGIVDATDGGRKRKGNGKGKGKDEGNTKAHVGDDEADWRRQERCNPGDQLVEGVLVTHMEEVNHESLAFVSVDTSIRLAGPPPLRAIGSNDGWQGRTCRSWVLGDSQEDVHSVGDTQDTQQDDPRSVGDTQDTQQDASDTQQ